MSSSPSSSEDNRPLKQSSSRQHITAKTKQSNPRQHISAKTLQIPARSKFPSLPSSITHSRGQFVSTKSKQHSVSEAPGVQFIPSPQHSTPVVDLTVSSSTSGNQGTEVPISIQPKSPISVIKSPLSVIKNPQPKSSFSVIKSPISVIKNPVCPDLIPISSDEESSLPKSQEGTSSNVAASGCSTQGGPVIISEPDGNVSSSSNSSRASSRRKKQTTFYGSPIRHSVNIIQSPSMSTPPSAPTSPDKKARFVVANSDSEPINQAGQSRVVLPDNSEGLYRKFTRFPKKSPSDNPLRRADK